MRSFFIVLAFTVAAFASELAGEKTSISDLPKHAIEQSQLSAPGSQPFYINAKVVEATNRENDGYNAEIEEYWEAPDKWRRTIKSADFSQTIIVNGDKISEQSTGDYYPNWLRTLVNAIFDPGIPLSGLDLSKSSDNPMIGGTKFCRRFAFRAGIPPMNNVFSTICFESGLLASVGIPGYEAAYANYKRFGDKLVARKVREYIEPGTELEASVEELKSLPTLDETQFAVTTSSPRLQTMVVSEGTLTKLASYAPPLQWPTIKGGKPKGVLSIYVCVDRNGKVRETYGLNSDHPEMTDAARKQVMNWKFKPAGENELPVQVEGILTFAYETKLIP